METFESSISLEQVLNLILSVLFGQATNKELSRPVIDLCRYNPHGNCVNHRHWPPGLDLWILVELRWPSNAQYHVVITNSIQLNGCWSFFDWSKLKEHELLLCVFAGIDYGISRVKDAICLLQSVKKKLFQIVFSHVRLHITDVDASCVQSCPEIGLEAAWQFVAEGSQSVSSLILWATLRHCASFWCNFHLWWVLRSQFRICGCSTCLLVELKARTCSHATRRSLIKLASSLVVLASMMPASIVFSTTVIALWRRSWSRPSPSSISRVWWLFEFFITSHLLIEL